MKVHVGTSGYAYKEWKGAFYPDKISPKEMLGFYSERLSSVEINNTFYRMPAESVLMSWAQQVPDDFVFALKAPQVITHRKRMRNAGEETDHFLKSLSALGGKLGPVLFQFPESFHVDHPVLKEFLGLLPHSVCCAFAFRSPSWLDAETLDLLRASQCSLCLEDTDENQVSAIISTAPWGYLRLRRSDYTDGDLQQWAQRVLSQEWERAFVFFKHEGEAKAPRHAMRFRELVDSAQSPSA
jgi:uncharacterized protein YecE (DUF72 family)